ncbi:dihydroneopterin aldolase [Fodinibius sp. Rm-B-1B1-1]|uniref:dihydroneopterin aldolase n=1 Tax=Fodinibius alkaliphilus TaxID=3140241 RepID=UPI00315A61F3
MDTLTIKSLRFKGYHGYYQQEREEGNNFEIDLTFHADLRNAGDSDRLEDTIDYQQVLKTVELVMKGPSVKLIETLTKRIGDQLFEQFSDVRQLKVAVRKLNPPLNVETAYSEIQMQWQR